MTLAGPDLPEVVRTYYTRTNKWRYGEFRSVWAVVSSESMNLFERRNAGLRPSTGIPKEKNPGLSGGFSRFSEVRLLISGLSVVAAAETIETRINNLLLGPSRGEPAANRESNSDEEWLAFDVPPRFLAVGDNLVGIRLSTPVDGTVKVERLELPVFYGGD